MRNHRSGEALRRPNNKEQWIEDATAFVVKQFAHQKAGYSFLSARRAGSSVWIDRAMKNRDAEEDVREFLSSHHRENFDLYFTVNSFFKPIKKMPFALPSMTAHADLDAANPHRHRPAPTSLWRSSIGRYQCLWQFGSFLPPHEVQAVSKQMVYRFGGDINGWSITKVLRIPHTFNHKPEYKRPLVSIVWDGRSPISRWPKTSAEPEQMGEQLTLNAHKHDWKEVVKEYRELLKKRGAYSLSIAIHEYPGDRSRVIHKLVASLHSVGASPDEIAAVVWRNPYFISKYGHFKDRYAKLDEEVSRILSKLGGAS